MDCATGSSGGSTYPGSLKPAIGGLVVGLIAVYLPQVLGGGYSWMQSAIDGRLAINSWPPSSSPRSSPRRSP